MGKCLCWIFLSFTYKMRCNTVLRLCVPLGHVRLCTLPAEMLPLLVLLAFSNGKTCSAVQYCVAVVRSLRSRMDGQSGTPVPTWYKKGNNFG